MIKLLSLFILVLLALTVDPSLAQTQGGGDLPEGANLIVDAGDNVFKIMSALVLDGKLFWAIIIGLVLITGVMMALQQIKAVVGPVAAIIFFFVMKWVVQAATGSGMVL